MAGQKQTGAAMSHELDKLLQNHTAKRRREKDAEDAEEKGHQEFRVLAVDAIEKVIAPALKTLSLELKGHGHEASVSIRVGADAYPSAHLTFRIVDQDDAQGAASVSRLSFSTTVSQDKFEVSTEIWGREGKDAGNNTIKLDSKRITEVDSSWVTAQGLTFVGCVLDRA
jgi:hypothetical protein